MDTVNTRLTIPRMNCIRHNLWICRKGFFAEFLEVQQLLPLLLNCKTRNTFHAIDYNKVLKWELEPNQKSESSMKVQSKKTRFAHHTSRL
jgi:hypothetical protein